MATNYTPEQIYNRVLEDGGKTPADDLAKEFGFRGHGQILQAIGKHILARMTVGENLAYPKLNVPLPEVRRSKDLNLAKRAGVDTKLQIGHAKLKELGDFDQVSAFEISVSEQDGAQVLVLKPVARFGDASEVTKASRPTRAKKAEAGTSSTLGSGSPSTSTLTVSGNTTATETPAEVKAAIPDEIPTKVTPAAAIPEPTAETELDDEDALNPNMI